MKVTIEQLNELGACHEARKWLAEQSTNDFSELYKLAKEQNHLNWANWYIVRIMTHEQQIKYAVFAAKQVLHIFEEQYPDDKWPRLAIEAAERCLENPDAAARAAAAAAAADAAYAAARATRAAYAATRAAVAAYAATRAATRAATEAADAAAYAAAAAADAAYAHKEMQVKILDYGISLLNEVIHEI